MKRFLCVASLIFLSFLLLGCNDPTVKLEVVLNPGIDTIEVNTEFVDAGAKATYGRQTPAVPVESNNVDPSKVGTYEIVYTISYQFQTVTIRRIVTVVDETPPSLILNPGVDTIRVGQSWVDAGALGSDNSLESVTITVLGSVDTSVVGDYTITYRGVDASGNSTEIVRIVSVIS